ncbi:MAG: lasso RiPP family leader peptide-containing protein [Spirochaetales bacterium]|jgi:hypothetical protein|nr:lasso RiPP family leader peptide-containing protein [Spirochaetales bacterium]
MEKDLSAEVTQDKKNYSSPKLVKWGSVADLTKGGRFGGRGGKRRPRGKICSYSWSRR